MFRTACKKVACYTLPMILCSRTVGGQVSGSLGTFVIVNADGWIVTAGHILEQLGAMVKEVAFVQDFQNRLASIRADASIDERERKRRRNQLSKPSNSTTDSVAQVWGNLPGQPTIAAAAGYMPVDVAIGRLEPFDPAWVSEYPVFKDPTRDFDPGAMLCRMGFPLHNVTPIWDATQRRFDLPPGTFPTPLFPLEGMFTRIAELTTEAGQPQYPFPYKWIETSSPGLKGQSGGPIYDERGTVWGIQCQTMSYDLGLDASTPQFLNVGVGVHPETLFAVFNAHGVKFRVSDY